MCDEKDQAGEKGNKNSVCHSFCDHGGHPDPSCKYSLLLSYVKTCAAECGEHDKGKSGTGEGEP